MDDFKVIIIGAGTTGLLIAQGLKKNNIKYEIFERSDAHTYEHRQRAWTMGLHWGARFISDNLPEELVAQLPSIEPDPEVKMTDQEEHNVKAFNGKTGELLVQAKAVTSRRANREKFRRLLATGIEIRYGKKFVSLEDDGKLVTAIFEDGTRVTGNALVGCDAASSLVRTFVVPPGKAGLDRMPYILFNFTSTFTAEQARFIVESFGHPVAKFAPHPEQNTWAFIGMCDINDRDDPSTWQFQIMLSLYSETDEPRDTSEERLAHFKQLASAYCEPWRSVAKWLKDDTYLTKDYITQWKQAMRWDNHGGRITLAGDAAHAMAPYRGQGVNHGLEDAAHYVQALTGFAASPTSDPLHTVIDAYDKEVFDRGTHEMKLSEEQGRFNTHWETFARGHVVKHGLQKIAKENGAQENGA